VKTRETRLCSERVHFVSEELPAIIKTLDTHQLCPLPLKTQL